MNFLAIKRLQVTTTTQPFSYTTYWTGLRLRRCVTNLRMCILILKWVYRDKKIAAQKIVVEYFSFLGGDSRPLANQNTLYAHTYYTGRCLCDHHLIIDDKNNIIETVTNFYSFSVVII